MKSKLLLYKIDNVEITLNKFRHSVSTIQLNKSKYKKYLGKESLHNNLTRAYDKTALETKEKLLFIGLRGCGRRETITQTNVLNFERQTANVMLV